MMKNSAEIAEWREQLTGGKCLPLSLAWKPTRQLRGSIVYPQRDVEALSSGLLDARKVSKTARPSTKDKSALKALPLALFSLRQTWATRRKSDYSLLG